MGGSVGFSVVGSSVVSSSVVRATVVVSLVACVEESEFNDGVVFSVLLLQLVISIVEIKRKGKTNIAFFMVTPHRDI